LENDVKKIIFGLILSLGLVGCAAMEPMKLTKKQLLFQYDYKIDGVKKVELWKRARNHIATIFGDSKSVMRVADEKEGVILGRGLVRWTFDALAAVSCLSSYDIRFKAKDEKARMQIELLNRVPALSECKGFPLPHEKGYNQIKLEFRALHLGMKESLNQKSSLDDF
jgi:hypothetical protein